jgi:hypothetical protein
MIAPPPQLPAHVDDLTSEWLTGMLAARYPGITVEASVAGTIAASATKVMLNVAYNDVGRAAGLPERVIAKGGLFGHAHEAQLAPLYRNEALFYGAIAPQLDLLLPACIGAQADDRTGIVVLEDLSARGAAFGEGRTPLTPALAADGLDQLAACHARFWNMPDRLSALGLLDIDAFWDDLLERPYIDGFEPITGEHPPSTLRAVDRARAVVARPGWFAEMFRTLHARNRERVACLVHFDPHIGNLFLADGRVGLLDWQTCTGYCWAWDVAYFLIGSLAVEDRRRFERELLGTYLERLRAHGAGSGVPDAEEGWEAYREQAVYGLIWAQIPEVMHPHHNALPVLERFWEATVDLDSAKTLGIRLDP